MNNDEKYKIVSNNFADLIVDNLILQDISTLYSDASFIRINSEYSLAFIPADKITSNIIYNVGYETIPKCYGLMSVHGYEALEADQLQSTPENGLNGQGVLVGFVDTGIDYRNLAFQYADHTSRIAGIWDQTIDSANNYPEGFYYGTEFSKEQINNALIIDNPLSVVPSTDDIGHGTMLAGITGGSYYADNGFAGVATNVEFVVVKLKPAKAYLKDFLFIPQDAICYEENDIMLGINYLIQVAREYRRPIAICIGVGASKGAHLSDGIFNNYLAAMGRLGDVAIIVAAGNEGNSGHHYFGEIVPSIGYNDVELNVSDNEPGFFMEFWGNAPNVFSIDLFAPTGELVGHIPTIFEQQDTIQIEFGETLIFIDNTLEDSLAGDQLILFRFKTPQKGVWRLRVSGIGNLLSRFHIWLPIHSFISIDTFFVKSDPYTTITTPGNEETVLTVTAYNDVNQNLYYYASKGFTKENNPKPDIAALGVNVLAPTIGNQFAWATGTSVAAAYATGEVSMLMEWGIIRGNFISMPSAMIRSMITGGAKRFPNVIYPNPDWGFGILDINNSILLAGK